MTEELKETFECRACRVAKRVEHIMWYVVGLIFVGLWVTALFIANYLLIFEFQPSTALFMIAFDAATVWVASTLARYYFEIKCNETKRQMQKAVDEAKKAEEVRKDLQSQQRINALRERARHWHEDDENGGWRRGK